MGLFELFNKNPSREKFGRIVMQFARENGFSLAMRFDEDEFRIQCGENGDQLFNLHNLYHDYCAAIKSERESVLSRYLHVMDVPERPIRFEDAKQSLMPIIRGKGLQEYLRLNQIATDDSKITTVSAPFSTDSVIMLAYDTEHTVQTLTASLLEEWGVSFHDALACAMDNLRDKTVDMFEVYSSGLFIGTWHDAYDSSRILLPDLIYRLDVGHEPVMMIPTRGRLLVASANNRNALLDMLHLARHVVDHEGRTVSALMYRIDKGRIIEYAPEDPELSERLEELKKQFLLQDYSEQKELFEKIHEKNNVDIFVATYSLMLNNETGRLRSFCTWAKDVDSLLPETDLVALVLPNQSGDADTLFVEWENLVKTCGQLMVGQEETYPVRYRVAGFPDEHQLGLLNQEKLVSHA